MRTDLGCKHDTETRKQTVVFGIAVLLVHFGEHPAIGGLRAIGFEINAAKGLDFVGLF